MLNLTKIVSVKNKSQTKSISIIATISQIDLDLLNAINQQNKLHIPLPCDEECQTLQ